jgi:hypothetical protein
LGDANLLYFVGLGLFGADFAAMLPDQLLPCVDGNKFLCERFAARVGEAIPVWQRSPVR